MWHTWCHKCASKSPATICRPACARFRQAFFSGWSVIYLCQLPRSATVFFEYWRHADSTFGFVDGTKLGNAYGTTLGTADGAAIGNTVGTEFGTAVDDNHCMELPLPCRFQWCLDLKIRPFFRVDSRVSMCACRPVWLEFFAWYSAFSRFMCRAAIA